MTAALDVVVIGGAGVDTNAYTTADLAPGDPGHAAGVETHFVRVRDYVGQTGGFASRLYAALGKRVAYVGGVGDDALGGLVRATLAGDGVDLSAVTVDPAGTSRSVNLMTADGRRTSYYDGRGASTYQPARALVEPLSLAAAAVGADGIIVEVHPNPDEAICDGPQQLVGADYPAYARKIDQAAALAGKTVNHGVKASL